MILVLILTNYIFLDALILRENSYLIYLLCIIFEILILFKHHKIYSIFLITIPTTIFIFMNLFFDLLNSNSTGMRLTEGSFHVLFALTILSLITLPWIQIIIIYKNVKKIDSA